MKRQYSLCIPYPEVCGNISPRALETLYNLAFGRFSEMTAVCSYAYQSVISEKFADLSEILSGIAQVEMYHCRLLAKAIFAFGAAPVFAGKYNYFSGSYVDYEKDVTSFLQNNIEGEGRTVADYREAADSQDNSSLSDLYYRIAMDEELHVRIFTDILGEFGRLNADE